LECFPFTVSTQLANRLVRSQTQSPLQQQICSGTLHSHTTCRERDWANRTQHTHTHTHNHCSRNTADGVTQLS